MPKKRLYAVKSLFRVEVFGEPTGADDDYDPDGMLIEERVVLLMARSLEDALRRGAKEADRYCAHGEHLNPYGQVVRQRRVDVLEASGPLLMFDGDAPEVWSSTSVLPSSVTDEELRLTRFGPEETEARLRLRRKYFNAQLGSLLRKAAKRKRK